MDINNVETGGRDEKQPNGQDKEGNQELEAEQQLKLKLFSAEKNFERVFGDNPRRKVKPEGVLGAAKEVSNIYA